MHNHVGNYNSTANDIDYVQWANIKKNLQIILTYIRPLQSYQHFLANAHHFSTVYLKCSDDLKFAIFLLFDISFYIAIVIITHKHRIEGCDFLLLTIRHNTECYRSCIVILLLDNTSDIKYKLLWHRIFLPETFIFPAKLVWYQTIIL